MPQMISVFFLRAVLWIQVDTLQQFTIAVENGTYATDLPIRTAILIYLFWYLCLFTRGYWFKDAATYNFLDIFTRKSYHNIANHQESIRQLAWKKEPTTTIHRKKTDAHWQPIWQRITPAGILLIILLVLFLIILRAAGWHGTKRWFFCQGARLSMARWCRKNIKSHGDIVSMRIFYRFWYII